jgi:hypothetical protein
MILNTFIKSKKLQLKRNLKVRLGKSISQCFKSKYPNETLKKVNISEKGLKLSVIDYPKDFLQSDDVSRIVNKFLDKYKEEIKS